MRGMAAEDAVVEALDTSGRAVLFAGHRSSASRCSGCSRSACRFLYGVAIAATVAVAFTVVAALTLLPALLGFFGPRSCAAASARPLRARPAQHDRRVAALGALDRHHGAAPGVVRAGAAP